MRVTAAGSRRRPRRVDRTLAAYLAWLLLVALGYLAAAWLLLAGVMV